MNGINFIGFTKISGNNVERSSQDRIVGERLVSFVERRGARHLI
jgi:hypothetical protein